MTTETLKEQLVKIQEYFNRSTRPLEEQHSGFSPAEGTFTVVGQFAHTAQTIDWFFDAAFSDHWNMDFEGLEKEARAVTSLTEARAWFNRAIEKAICVTEAHTVEEWMTPFPPNPIMGEAPRIAVFSAVQDHTAHHRGALTVYERLLGLVPPMPYMDM